MKNLLVSGAHYTARVAPVIVAATVGMVTGDAWAGGGNMIQTIGDNTITMGTALGVLGATAGVMGAGAGVMMRSMPVIATGASVTAGSGLWIGARQIVQQVGGGTGGGAGLDDLHNIAVSSVDVIGALISAVFG